MIALQIQGKKYEIRSNCPYHYDGNYKSASKSTANAPSTNIPIHCPYCAIDTSTNERVTIWKYNLERHLLSAHPDLEREGLDKKLTKAQLRDKHVKLEEAERLGVQKETVMDWRKLNDIPNTSDIDEAEDDDDTRALGQTSVRSRAHASKARKRSAIESGSSRPVKRSN